jgi:G:T/U-mismatch repair DNA glycosylase
MDKIKVLEDLVAEEAQRVQQAMAQLNDAYRVLDIIKNTHAALSQKLQAAKEEKKK